MASGVKVCDETVEQFQEMKLRKLKRFMMLNIDGGVIKVNCSEDKNGSISQEQDYNNFLHRLPPDDCRYCFVDLAIPQKNGALKDTMFIITWCPNGAPTKSLMLYSTSKRALLDKCREGTIGFEASDCDDINYSELLSKGCK